MLKVEKVTKKYGNLTAVDNLSFEVKPGCIFGLLGLNGAGKTTTFRMILGLIDDYTGQITIDDKPINYQISDQIGFLTEERSLLTKMTVLEQITYYGVLKSIPESDIENRLDYWLKRFGISDYKYKKIKELSKGNQQKVQFISAIINEPKLLILDEPFSGLDPINVELFKKIILELKAKGTSIILSSHRMEHIELFCEELVILVKGKSVLQGKLKDIKKNYQKKNLLVRGNIDLDEIGNCEGVEKITQEKDEYIISISNDSYVDKLFKKIAKYDNISKFCVEDPSLNEIFLSIVGEKYE